MPVITINFRDATQAGQGTQDDRLSPYVLSLLESPHAEGVQVSRGTLAKSPGWLKLSSLTPSGNAFSTDGTVATGASFPDHADYDLGLRFTLDVTYKMTTIPPSGTEPIYWRADSSNNKVSALEINDAGKFVFTHRDSADTETTLTSAHALTDGEQAQVRVVRHYGRLIMWFNRQQSATRADLSTTATTKASSTKWYLNVGTVTDGDTVTGVSSCKGVTDEFRLWRDAIFDGLPWAYTEYPYMAEETLALYARLNDDSLKDYSKNSNDGSALASPTEDSAALVTALSSIQQVQQYRSAAGVERWLVWANGNFYAQAVT